MWVNNLYKAYNKCYRIYFFHLVYVFIQWFYLSLVFHLVFLHNLFKILFCFFLISIYSFGCWSQLWLCWTSIHTALKLTENGLENHLLLTNTWLFIYTHKVDIMYRCLYINTVWHDLLGSLSCYLWSCLYKSCFMSVVNIHRKK